MRSTGRICDDRSRDGPKNPQMQYIPITEHEELLAEAVADAKGEAFEALDTISLMLSLIERGEFSAATMAGMDQLVKQAKAYRAKPEQGGGG